jgi:hypothetical protein
MSAKMTDSQRRLVYGFAWHRTLHYALATKRKSIDAYALQFVPKEMTVVDSQTVHANLSWKTLCLQLMV